MKKIVLTLLAMALLSVGAKAQSGNPGLEEAIQRFEASARTNPDHYGIKRGNVLIANGLRGIPDGTLLYPIRWYARSGGHLDYYFYQDEFNEWKITGVNDVQGGTGGVTLPPRGGPRSGAGLRSGVGDVYSKAGVRAPAPTPTPIAAPTTTSSSTDDRIVGYKDGRYYGEHRETDSWWKEHYGKDATFVQVREFAEKFSYPEGEVDGPARDAYIEGFIDGYYDGAGIPEGK
jgi:hypothetical protein